MDDLEKMLREKASKALECEWMHPFVQYAADVNPDAATDDWRENQTSYIWKVGVLSVVDSNKRDYGHLFIGHQREPDARLEFIGELYWQDGENDDVARCLRRYLKCAAEADLLFECDEDE